MASTSSSLPAESEGGRPRTPTVERFLPIVGGTKGVQSIPQALVALTEEGPEALIKASQAVGTAQIGIGEAVELDGVVGHGGRRSSAIGMGSFHHGAGAGERKGAAL